MATSNQLDDVTECPICTEVYTDPRVLPCVHTYCLKCLETYCKDKQPGDELACPLCRKEFTLPSNGVGDLPKNFFVDKFLQMKELSSVESNTSPCEACSGDEVTEKKVATVYCVECQQKLCQSCEEDHRKFKVTQRHKTVEISGETKPQIKCKKHACKDVEIYCVDCNMVVCTLCYIADHNGHRCSEVHKSADGGTLQSMKDSENVAADVEKCKQMLRRIDNERKNVEEEIRKIGVEICTKAEQLKQMIDDHKEKLMNELSSMKQKRMKEIESLREEIERQLMSMESYKKYVDEVRKKGTACDISRAASGLHDRADELLKFDVIERTLGDLGHADVTFTSSNYVMDDVKLTLGRLDAVNRAVNSKVPTLTRVIPSQDRNSVSAVTSLGDDIFVMCRNSRQVEVYDAETFTLQHHITVYRRRTRCVGLAACAVNNCLYASDDANNSIHRVELSCSNAVKKWSVGRFPAGVSVNKAHNLVLACTWVWANKLQEYTTHGSLVREICLQAGVRAPWHAIQLSTGHYVVSQYNAPGVVSVVGVDGQVIHSYGQSQTSDVGEMKHPSSLAVTKNDDILVADEDNNRILSIIRSTGCVQELALSVDGGIHSPSGLCLDESRRRLYVSEFCGECRLLVFDNVNL